MLIKRCADSYLNTEDQIIFVFKQAETGISVSEVCRKIGISRATFYKLSADRQDGRKYGQVGVSELRRLRQLEEENSQLKKLVADLSLDKQILKDVLKKNRNADRFETSSKKGVV